MSSLARVGTVVAGKYKLLNRLGGGGMGEVYRAEHQYAGRVVALKLLRRDFAADPDLTRRFFQEAQAVNKIRHPNIVDVLDAGLCEEGPYVAMEILEGSSLSAALARAGRFDLTAALAVILPMLSALEAAHRHGIVHRDLKPENVFLARTDGGTGAVIVKLVDFGIAKILGSSTNTNTGVVFGTPDYLSPEQASGEGVIDGRSDLFAVGIVLFELLTGQRPFEAATAVATAYRIVHAEAPRLASLGIAVDERVQEALDIALAKSQENRFPTAQTFIDMLAPVAPDGAMRRAALVSIVDSVTGMEPTVAAPRVGPSANPELPRDAAPVTGDAIPTPAALPTPIPVPPPPAPKPVAPTLASRELLARPYAPVAAESREPTSPGLREPSAPPFREPATTPARMRARTPTPTPARHLSSPNIGTIPPRTPGRASPIPSASRTLSVRRALPWTPRPLPSHVRGKCHVRGTVPRAVNRWIERTYGGARYDELLAALPAELAETYRGDAFNALVWYELESLDTLLEAATAIVLGGDVAIWRTLAREHFDRDIGPIFRGSTVRVTDPVSVLKRTVSSWARLYDFANARVAEASTSSGGSLKRVSLRFDGFDAASLALRNVTVGSAEALVRSAGQTDLTSRVMSGEASFARDFEIELAWPPRP